MRAHRVTVGPRVGDQQDVVLLRRRQQAIGTEAVATLNSVIGAVESNVDGLIANGTILEHTSTRGHDDTVNSLRVLREAR